MKFLSLLILLAISSCTTSNRYCLELRDCQSKSVGLDSEILFSSIDYVENKLLNNGYLSSQSRESYVLLIDSLAKMDENIILNLFEDRGLLPWTFIFQVSNSCPNNVFQSDSDDAFESEYLLIVSKLEYVGYKSPSLVEELVMTIPEDLFKNVEYRLPILTYMSVLN
ncbi:MAG: hypothetical protein HWD92_13675 [Flavobacteriia bacterium]|nr:hypothetical protein [Flavobacteriia bacterium]